MFQLHTLAGLPIPACYSRLLFFNHFYSPGQTLNLHHVPMHPLRIVFPQALLSHLLVIQQFLFADDLLDLPAHDAGIKVVPFAFELDPILNRITVTLWVSMMEE